VYHCYSVFGRVPLQNVAQISTILKGDFRYFLRGRQENALGGKVTGKGKACSRTDQEGPEGEEIQLYSFSNLGAVSSGWSTSRLSRFTPGKELVPIVQEAG